MQICNIVIVDMYFAKGDKGKVMYGFQLKSSEAD